MIDQFIDWRGPVRQDPPKPRSLEAACNMIHPDAYTMLDQWLQEHPEDESIVHDDSVLIIALWNPDPIAGRSGKHFKTHYGLIWRLGDGQPTRSREIVFGVKRGEDLPRWHLRTPET